MWYGIHGEKKRISRKGDTSGVEPGVPSVPNLLTLLEGKLDRRASTVLKTVGTLIGLGINTSSFRCMSGW